MQFIFVIHLLATFMSFCFALFLQTLHIPLLRYIGPYQYPIYYEKQKLKLTLITFPIFSLEIFTSVVLMVTFLSSGGRMTEAKQNSFFIYLSTIIILLLIHLITFYFVKPLHKKLLKTWEEKVLKELKWWNLGRTGLWLLRIIVLISLIIR
jgi:hypothetical protein